MTWVQKLRWPGITKFNKATRHALTDPITGQTDTYVKANGRFKFYWNLRTGHAVSKFVISLTILFNPLLRTHRFSCNMQYFQ